MQTDAERRLITEITNLADRIRALRAPGGRQDGAITALEAQSRSKWEQLRALRAGPADPDALRHFKRSSRS